MCVACDHDIHIKLSLHLHVLEKFKEFNQGNAVVITPWNDLMAMAETNLEGAHCNDLLVGKIQLTKVNEK